MVDCFYLTEHEKASMDEVIYLSKDCHFTVLFYDLEKLEIYIKSNIRISIRRFGLSNIDLESLDAEDVRRISGKVCLLISVNYMNIDALVDIFLKNLIHKFGGCVLCDDDWGECYHLDDLNEFKKRMKL
jgi:hypothetical protein